ncbi:MAG TPA: TadE family protein [Armatimonadota bacterium]|nr:TadE family protein [Armatimonadota bacterium]
MIGARCGKDHGQTLVEFTLAALLFFLVTFGLMQLALIYHTKLVLDHASREGARYAATRGLSDPQLIKDYIRGRAGTLNPPLQDDNITLNTVTAEGDPAASVSLSYAISPTAPLIAPLLPHSFPLKTSSIMRMEQ